MRSSRLGDMLLGAGVVVGLAAVVGMVVGFEPSRLPPALLDIAAYKLTIAAAAGLLGAGAVVRRHAKRDRENDSSRLAALEQNAALPQPPAHVDSPNRETAKSEVPRRP